jgi:hypothetical protein
MAVVYGMPFHTRDVLGSYPSAQLAAVDRDTQIFKYGQIFKNNKNPNQRLVAARTLAGISPGYQEARIESLAGDNFSQRAFQEEQRVNFALQKQYIKDRSEYMEQKTSNRLLRGSLVQALSTGGRTTGDRTPFADLDLDSNFDFEGGSRGGSRAGSLGGSRAGSGRASGAQSPGSGGGMAAEFQGLGSSFWGEGSEYEGSQAGEFEGSFSQQEEQYGMGVEPINLNIDPARLERIQAVRAVQSEERARMEIVGSLVGDMVGGLSGHLASQQEQDRRDRLRGMLYESGLYYDVQNPNDMTEEQLRTVARVREGQRRRGFFGRAQQASEETFLDQPLEIESSEMGGRSLQDILATVDEFGSRGSVALAGGGVGRGGGVRGRQEAIRPDQLSLEQLERIHPEAAARIRGVIPQPGSKEENAEIRKAARQLSGIRDLSLGEARQMIEREGGLQAVQTQLRYYPGSAAEAGRDIMRFGQAGSRVSQAQAAQAAEAALAGQIGRSRGVRALARRTGAFNPKEEEKGFSLFD